MGSKPKTKLRCALYLRVSTNRKRKPKREREQTVENQRPKLLAFAKAMGWAVAAEYEDRESGARGDRPRFKAMMDAAAKREFDVVLAWSLDRFSREGIGKTCDHLRRLDGWKVAFRSLQEPFLDTTGEFGELVVAIFAFFASFERRRLVERVRAGLDRARSQGKRLGRPPVDIAPATRKRAAELRKQGATVREVAADLKLSHGVAQRLLAAAKPARRR